MGNHTINDPSHPETIKFPSNVVPISARQAAITNAAARLEKDPAARKDKALVPWFMAVLCLPYKDPEGVSSWERTNGNATIQIVPEMVEGVARYPYGSIPRLLMIWMCTQAQKTGSPVLDVASSLDGFVKAIGLASGGKQRAIVMDQMDRLFNASIRLTRVTDTERDGEAIRREEKKNFFLVESSDVLFARADQNGQQPLWGSTIELSPAFFEMIKDQSFPVFTHALHAFKNSPLQTDIYLFMVARLFRLRSQVRITWAQLNAQFGAQYGRDRAFKAVFVKHLTEVSKMYPEANFEVTSDYLILRPSKRHVPAAVTEEGTRKRRKLQ